MHRWMILLEEQRNRGQHYRIITEVMTEAYSTKERARRAAHELAQSHRPRHPSFEKSRTVLREDDNHYTVIVQGATGRFVFKLTVCEQLAV